MKTGVLFCLFFAICSASPWGRRQPRQPPMERNMSFEEAVVSNIKYQFMKKANCMPREFTLVSYATQSVLGGCNFFAKVKIFDNEYVHIRVHQPSPYMMQPMMLVAFKRGMSLDDPIEYFDNEPQPQRFAETVYMREIPSPPVLMPPIRLPMPPPMVPQPPPMMAPVRVRPAPPPPSPPSPSPSDQLKREIRDAIAYEIRAQFQQKTGYDCPMFELVSKTLAALPDCVYLVKVRLSASEYAHLKIKKPGSFPVQPMSLIAYQRGKMLSEPMIDFDQSFPAPPPPPDPTKLGEMQNVDDKGQQILSCIMEEFKRRCPYLNPSVFLGISMRHTTESDPKYGFIKVQTGLGEFVHLKIGGSHGRPELVSFQTNKRLSDPIEYF